MLYIILMHFMSPFFLEWRELPVVWRDSLWSLMSYSGVVGVAVALLSVGALTIFARNRNLRWKGMSWFFFVVWLLVFVVYDVGMYTGDFESLFLNIPMAMLYACGAFLMDSDVSAIHERFYHSTPFMCIFSFVHFAAAFLSMWFVIRHFGFNIMTSLERFFASRIGRPKNTVYVFWGMNDATYHLAKSINDHYMEVKDDSYRIIVVRSSRDTDTTDARNGLERLFDFLSMKNQDMEQLQAIDHCLTASTFVSLPDVKVTSPAPDIMGNLGLLSIMKLIKNKTTGDVHVFFLSKDEADNIKAVANLRQDRTLAEVMAEDVMVNGQTVADENGNNLKRQVRFYCHARHNSINRVIEDLDVSCQVDVRIVDTSFLSIECLKRDVHNQPISFVDIDKKKNYGTVLTPFTSLIVGFGETGKDALRYLYEFGAFLDSDDTQGARRSKFNCHVVDQHLDQMVGPFKNASPRIFATRNKQEQEPSPLVELHAMDYNSDAFFNTLLPQLAPDLNYVVIAVGNDEAGMTLAVRILKYMRRQGRDFKHLRIFVRSYQSTLYPHMEKIRQHYNEQEERIVLFGDEKQLYTYNMVIEDEFEKRGREYYEAYRALNPENDEDGSWLQRRKKLRGLITLTKNGINPSTGCPIFIEKPVVPPTPATLDNLQKLRRKETQDKANALHEATKIYILETIIPNWYTQLVPRLFKSHDIGGHKIVRINRDHQYAKNPKFVTYTELDAKAHRLMDNLAKLEHLRWNASHEILGYTPMPANVPNQERGCNEGHVQHNCIVDWEELDAESDRIDYISDYKIFDYGVVETTIDIYRRMREKEEK